MVFSATVMDSDMLPVPFVWERTIHDWFVEIEYDVFETISTDFVSSSPVINSKPLGDTLSRGDDACWVMVIVLLIDGE